MQSGKPPLEGAAWPVWWKPGPFRMPEVPGTEALPATGTNGRSFAESGNIIQILRHLGRLP